MIVVPAIDLLGGKVVRLEQGDRARATVYHDDAVALVQTFAQRGATRIHVVDLDGAFEGGPVQTDLIAEMSNVAVRHASSIQVGGGLRDVTAIESVLARGVASVVIGTLAVREPTRVHELCARHRGRVVIAADVRDGKLTVAGWRQTEASTTVDALARAAQAWGAAAILTTDASRDGMQVGPAVAFTAALQRELSIPVFASGGIAKLADLDACKQAGIGGVVLGRALYEGAFTLEEALARC